MKTILEESNKFLLNNYARKPLAISHGTGSHFWDTTGKRYLDFFPGFGACGISGHCHPKVTAAIVEQSQSICAHGNQFTSQPQIAVATRLVKKSFGEGKVFFCHSGAEANEAALKLVRKKGGAEKQNVIVFDSCFHGRTYGSLSLCPSSFQEGFGDMLGHVIRLPLNDVEKLKDAFNESIAGVFLEPIQGEGGVNLPSQNFVETLRSLCDQFNALYVSDEVWTAPARTGKWFAYQYFDNALPDIITMGKALGGGAPVGACIIREEHAATLGPGTHGCTMGGNPLCLAAANAALDLIEVEELANRALELEKFLFAELKSVFGTNAIDIRGRGLFIGVELASNLNNANFVDTCLENGLYLGTAKNNVIRLAPALNTSQESLIEALSILEKVLKEV